MILIPEGTKPWKCVSNDMTRYVLTSCYFDGEYITATNGHHLTAIKVVTEGKKKEEVPGYIPVDVLKTVCKQRKPSRLNQQQGYLLKLYPKYIMDPVSRTMYPRVLGTGNYPDKYPNIKTVFKTEIDRDHSKRVVLHVNPAYLMNVAEAVGSKSSISISIDPSERSNPLIIASGATSNITHASLVMPIRSDDTALTILKRLTDQNLSPDGATDAK